MLVLIGKCKLSLAHSHNRGVTLPWLDCLWKIPLPTHQLFSVENTPI